MATKTKKMPFKSYTHSKWCYVGKVPKIIFENLTKKMIIFEAFLVGMEKYLKVVFSTESVWKIAIVKIEKIMKIKNGSNKKIVFSRPLEKYVLGN